MKTLGIVGGIGPESTIEYYRFILDACLKRAPDGGAPHIVIDSIDVDVAIAMLVANDRASLAAYLGDSVDRLVRAGADVALMAANTAHIVFDQVQRRSPIPIVSIVRAACDEAIRLGVRRLALLGTGFTMRAGFYPEVFAAGGIGLVTPNDAEQAWLHDKYINELLRNRFLPETRAAVLAAIDRMRREDGVEGVVLAGTELPLLLRGHEPSGLPFLDTTVLHVGRAVTEILAEEGNSVASRTSRRAPGPVTAGAELTRTGTAVLDSLGRYLDDSVRGSSRVVPLRPMAEIAAGLRARHLLRSGGLQDDFSAWIESYLDATTRLHHPGSMAHQVGVPAPFSALGELVQGVTNNPMAIFEMGPGAATLEMTVIEWMLERAGWNAPRWPGDTSAPGSRSAGVLTHGGSLANLTALLAARAAAAPEAWESGGLTDLVVVAPPSSHYSVARATSILGLGARAVVSAPVDARDQIVPDRLPAVCDAARARGAKVMAVVANGCATATGLYDRLDEIARFCEEAGYWFHVDGAHGATALLSPRHRGRMKGVERASSMVWDAHKMLRAPCLCAAVLLRDERWFDAAFHEDASYLFYGSQSEGFDFIHRTVECTKSGLGLRAFVALALEGERAIADFHDDRCALATRAAALIRNRPGFEVPVEPESNIVCFRWTAADNEGQIAIRDALLRQGSHHLSSAEVGGTRYLRLSLMTPSTTDATIEDLLDRIERLAAASATT